MQRTDRSQPFTLFFPEGKQEARPEDHTYRVLLLEKSPLYLTNRKAMNEDAHHL